MNRLLTEQELDTALATLLVDAETRHRGAPDARARFMTALAEEPRQPRRRGLRLTVAAAAVIAAAVGGVVITGGVTGETPVAAAAELRHAADRLATAPAEYQGFRYIRSFVDETVTDPGGYRSTGKVTMETWIPADRKQEWLRRAQVVRDSVPYSLEERAVCGDFGEKSLYENPLQRCAAGSWFNPTPEFAASLPTDPAALRARILADSTKTAPLRLVATAFADGTLSPQVQANLYRAVAGLPGLTITEQVLAPSGRTGTAFAVSGEDNTEIVVDPATGEFLGQRSSGPAGGDRSVRWELHVEQRAIVPSAG